MKTLNTLYHLALADFLERTRRYSFLIMLGLIIFLGYAAASGQMIMRIYPDYTGELNSAWVGTLMALTVSFFLGLFGFFLIKGSIARDYISGVGQIMATTQMTRPIYMLGKWMSNFAVLSVMILILLCSGVLMNLFAGTPIDLWAMIAPMIFIAFPCMAFISGFAVLFESIHWLRGSFGNFVYFLLFPFFVIPIIELKTYIPLLDVLGFRLIGDAIARAAQLVYPDSTGGFTFTITVLDNPKIFPFSGIIWSSEVVIWRIVILFLGLAIPIMASIFFDRFNPSKLLPSKKRGDRTQAQDVSTSKPTNDPDIHLTPIPVTRHGFRIDTIYLAEIKLLLKGQHWWWYGITTGLIIAQFANTTEVTRILLVISWLWLLPLLSNLGSRENRYNTQQIVFSAPHSALTQLSAAWISAFTLLAMVGSGALFKFMLLGEIHSIFGWIAGVVFIPSLALTFGVLTGSNKPFEIIYILWMYLVLQRVPLLDFVGITPDSPWIAYLTLSPILAFLSYIVRNRKSKNC